MGLLKRTKLEKRLMSSDLYGTDCGLLHAGASLPGGVKTDSVMCLRKGTASLFPMAEHNSIGNPETDLGQFKLSREHSRIFLSLFLCFDRLQIKHGGLYPLTDRECLT